jgi:hypothetical protein
MVASGVTVAGPAGGTAAAPPGGTAAAPPGPAVLAAPDAPTHPSLLGSWIGVVACSARVGSAGGGR